MEDTPADAAGSGRRTRTRGAEASRRTAALHRLRAVRRGESRASDAIQVKADDPIYDPVAEEEYNALVARRREEAAGEFIIGDHGLGHDDDWSQRALPPQAKRHLLLLQQQSAKAASLSAATAAAKTSQQISSMFTSSVFKRPGSYRAKSLVMATDSIVDKIIAEFAPDENDREERRRRLGRVIVGADETVRSNNGNDMAVELEKNDVEMETNLEEISGSCS